MKILKKMAVATLALTCMSAAPVLLAPQAVAAEMDKATSREITALMNKMTLEEKVAQLSCVWLQKKDIINEDGSFSPEKMKVKFPNSIGCITRPQDNQGFGTAGVDRMRTIEDSVKFYNDVQKYMIEETRLGIPAIMHEEGLHGFMAEEGTVFPQAIALASTWNPELIEEIYTQVAKEIRARGVRHVLSPVVDVARDARWGRFEETYGEDPYLVSRMGVAAVFGFQGRDKELGDDRVLATLKHMTGHGEPEAGMNVGPANISERILREQFFPPFKAAIKEANAAAVMASYNEIDGVPSHVSQFLLKDVLRDEWGFKGIVVSDYFAIDELETRHSIVSNIGDAGEIALRTGVDLELPDPAAYPLMVERVQNGQLSEKIIDRSLRKVLEMKHRAGLLDETFDFPDAAKAEAVTGNAEARALALKASHQAITLLKNDDNFLPLDKTSLKRVAVIGPNAANIVLGGYTQTPRQSVSILEGIKAELGDDVRVDHAPGVKLTDKASWWIDEINLADRKENLKMIKQAKRIAKRADVIILAIGGNESTSREAWAETHMGDRNSLELIGEQNELVAAMLATKKPIVTVMVHGRPLAINDLKENDKIPAIVDTWILGQETGTAVADVLFGKVNPSGKLPVTIPRDVGNLPHFYNHKPTSRRGFAFTDATALYPFGYGMSYTSFEMSEPTLSAASIKADGNVVVTTTVSNTGDREGTEVVQLYIRDVVSSVTRPVMELKAFKRVELGAGESKEVSFTLDRAALEMYNLEMKKVVEPGDFTIMVGNSSDNTKSVTLTVE